MAASIQEELMALGSWSADLKDWDPDLRDLCEEAKQKTWPVFFYWGERHIYTGLVLTTRRRQISGRGLEWYLGLDDTGPTVREHDYLSHVSRLSNGGFEDSPFGVPLLQWRTTEDSKWIQAVGDAHAGTGGGAYVNGEPIKDDLLISDETWPAKPGQHFFMGVYIKRGPGYTGRIRIRTVYEGYFDPPNLILNPGIENGQAYWSPSLSGTIYPVSDSSNARTGEWSLRLSESAVAERLYNGSFEENLYAWYTSNPAGTWATDATPLFGSLALVCPSGGPVTKQLIADSSPATTGSADPIPVFEGEEYRFGISIKADVGTNGEAWVQLSQTGDDIPISVSHTSTDHVTAASSAGDYQWVEGTVSVQTGMKYFTYSIFVINHTTGTYHFDGAFLHRTKGNTDIVQGWPVSVTPERTYKAKAWVRPSPSVSGGMVRLQARFFSEGRTDAVTISPGIEPPAQQSVYDWATATWLAVTPSNWQLLEWDITPPSGYAGLSLSVLGTDIASGSFYVDDIEVRDADSSSVVVDSLSTFYEPNWLLLGGTSTAPVGTEKVRFEVVAEHLGGGWLVDDAFLIRDDLPASTFGQLVRDFLKCPKTGRQLVDIGTIYGDDTIPYDWTVHRLTNRAALNHVSTVLAVPRREWYIDPRNKLHWGTAEELFEDRDFVLTPNDLVLLGDPDVEESVEDRVDEVHIIGADRRTLKGGHYLVEGLAASTTEAVDWNGHPLFRTEMVEDSIVDHPAYANAYADQKLDDNGSPLFAVDLELADWEVVGQFDVGDTIHPYVPHILEDPTNEKVVQGEPVWPRPVRVKSRTWTLGEGPFRAEIRPPGQEPIDITDRVLWSGETGAALTVGDVRPDFISDPQGGSQGRQFRRWYASSSR